MTSDRKWTVEDVQRLVEAAQKVQADGNASFLQWMSLDDLSTALAPFQPDPDAELIERMAEVIADDPFWDALKPESKQRYRVQAANALAAVRDHDAKAVAK